MAQATITLHLPAYRERALKLQNDRHEAVPAYDEQIDDYVKFLKDEAGKAGYAIATDAADSGPAYSIDAASHDAKTAAHDWLDTQPDIWNWMP